MNGFLVYCWYSRVVIRRRYLRWQEYCRMIWHSEMSDNYQSLIDIRSEEYDSWINYVVARSTSSSDYSAVCLPYYIVFECRIRKPWHESHCECGNRQRV